MLLSDSKKFIFIAVGRTASTSIERTLNNYIQRNPRKIYNKDQLEYIKKFRYYSFNRGKHILAKDAKNIIVANKWNSYFKFAFSRNPWDRILSVFMERKIKDTKNKTKNGFKKFVLNGEGPDHLMTELVLDENNKLLVDYIGRYENLNECFNYVCNKIGIKENLRWENKRNHEHYTKYYDSSLIEFVGKKYKKDIDYFKYSFGE